MEFSPFLDNSFARFEDEVDAFAKETGLESNERVYFDEIEAYYLAQQFSEARLDSPGNFDEAKINPELLKLVGHIYTSSAYEAARRNLDTLEALFSNKGDAFISILSSGDTLSYKRGPSTSEMRKDLAEKYFSKDKIEKQVMLLAQYVPEETRDFINRRLDSTGSIERYDLYNNLKSPLHVMCYSDLTDGLGGRDLQQEIVTFISDRFAEVNGIDSDALPSVEDVGVCIDSTFTIVSDSENYMFTRIEEFALVVLVENMLEYGEITQKQRRWLEARLPRLTKEELLRKKNH